MTAIDPSGFGLQLASGDTSAEALAAAYAALAAVQLVISDCDGTLLLNDKSISPAAQQAVRGLRGAGVKFTVASSRPSAGMRSIVETLGVDMPFASYNGGNLVAPASWNVLRAHPLPRDAVETAVASLARAGIDTWVFIGDAWYLTNPDGEYVPRERRTVGYDGVVVPDFDSLDLSAVNKIVGSTSDAPALERMETELQASLAGRALAARSQRYYLDITHVEANKGQAVRELAELEGVALARVAVLGDMTNDIAMFEVAGLAIAMGQATDTVRKHARFVSAANNDDGFAIAINALLAARSRAAG